MKKYYTVLLLLLTGLISGPNALQAQANRTLETKVVDVLAQLPTEDQEHSDRLCREVLEMGDEGIREFTARLVPAEQGNDSQARYLLHSLAVYSGGQNAEIAQGNMVENAYIEAIKEAEDDEVKAFLIRRLAFCGSNASVKFLAPYLEEDNALFDPALSVIKNINSEDSAPSVLRAARSSEGSRMYDLMQALGEMQYPKANSYLTEKANNREPQIQRYALRTLAKIGSKESYSTLFKAARHEGFRMDIRESMLAYLDYGNVVHAKGNDELAKEVAEQVLQNCTSAEQLPLRAGGIQLLAAIQGAEANPVLVQEVANSDREYRGTVLDAAAGFMGPEQYGAWIKACNAASPEAKTQIVNMLGKHKDAEIFEKCLMPALSDRDTSVRIAAIKAMDHQEKGEAIAALRGALQQKGSAEEYQAIQETLLRICTREDASQLSADLSGLHEEGRIVVVNVLSERRAASEFSKVVGFLGQGSPALDKAIYASLHNLAGENDISELLSLLERAPQNETVQVQQALIQVLDESATDHSDQVFQAYASSNNKERILPVLVAIGDQRSLELVSSALGTGSPEVQAVAVETLVDWRNDEAIPHLFLAATSPGKESIHTKAYYNYLKQVVGSSHPDDQKLLLVKKVLPYNRSQQEKEGVIRAAGEIKTFLSLVFVSEFLNDPNLIELASNTAIRIALPTPDTEGMHGEVVRDIVSRSVNNLTGQDSQYLKIDVKEFLDNMPKDKGYLPIFNGKDLTGWQGLVEDPFKRSKMTASQLSQKQAAANTKMAEEWIVENGTLKFIGKGFDNICSVKKYGDFEMILEWRIQEGGDTGIYLRGTPQVQIWDTALTDKGAEVGSGGLYNNESNPSKPLMVADNPVGDWNTFRIRMVGDRVTVLLNGQLVTDGVALENYWNRELPLPAKEAIELQAHQEPVEFRNIYVKELDQGGYALSEEEKNAGFEALFNGKDLDQWEGNKRDYLVEGGDLVVRPVQGDHGNLYTQNEYSDFILRFEFQLTEGANNGLGIHAPTEGDVAYVGKEIQILDNTADIYANLEDWQYHGSVYGIMKAKRGYLKPVGEWNYEEVVVQGDDIRVTLNGTVILEGNMKEAAANGTLDGKEHPGLQRNSGRIAFLGHGSELRFRNIRIKELDK